MGKPPCLATLLLFLAVPAGRAESTFPMVMGISPVAVQSGTTSDCVVTARYSLHGASRVIISGEGVTAQIPPQEPVKPNKGQPNNSRIDRLKVRFKAATGALPGVRDVRIVTPRGVSTLGQIVVVRDPVIREKPNNDTMATAQPIKLPATVCGAIEKVEDVDFYKFTASAGTALVFHVRSQRLENKIHDLQEHCDPILTLRDARGTVLAMNDNYFFGDPLLFYAFSRAGEYYLEIRDVRYSGNPNWQYEIEINDRPFVTNVYPSRLLPGAPTRLQLIGFHLPPDPYVEFALPADTADGYQWVELPLGDGRVSNPVPVIVSRLPDVREISSDHAAPQTAQPISVPAGICGRIDHEGEVDCYAFEAKKGEHFSFEVIARAHQSGLDSNLRILNAKGRRLAENDDAVGRFVSADSLIENWVAPASDKYFVEIRDLHFRGGPEFVYFLAVTRSQPSFTLDMDSDKTLLTPGLSGAIFVRALRKNGFKGEIQLAIDGLPPGVTAQRGRILATGKDGCIVVHASPDAAQAAANVRVTGSAVISSEGESRTLTVAARPLQELYTIGGGRAHFPVEMHTVSVGEPLDIRSVSITPSNLVLKPGQSKRVEVTVKRSEGFTGNLTLTPVYQHLATVFGNCLPPGVTVDERNSRTRLTGDQSKGWITFKASADAKPVERQQAPVMVHVSINFAVKYTYCGEPLLVTVVKP
jgi:hypothetical protein